VLASFVSDFPPHGWKIQHVLDFRRIPTKIRRRPAVAARAAAEDVVAAEADDQVVTAGAIYAIGAGRADEPSLRVWGVDGPDRKGARGRQSEDRMSRT
jgi:hypothetical protein